MTLADELTADPCEEANIVLRDPRADELSRRRAQAHQSGCPLCLAEGVQRRDMADVADVADVADRAVTSSPARLIRPGVAKPATRALLLGLSAVQFGLAAPWLFGTNPYASLFGVVSDEHLTRDGALGVTMAVAGLLTAWRPRYSFAMLAVVGAVVLMQLGAGIADLGASGHTHFERVHILEAVLAALIVLTATTRDVVADPKAPRP